jgi:hypothetical protein
MVSLNFIFNIIDFTKIDFTEVYHKYFFYQYVVTVMKNEVYFGVVITASHVTLSLQWDDEYACIPAGVHGDCNAFWVTIFLVQFFWFQFCYIVKVFKFFLVLVLLQVKERPEEKTGSHWKPVQEQQVQRDQDKVLV